MSDLLVREALEETFSDVEKLIYHLVHRFIRTYGGEFDEILSEAYFCFMKAYKEWDPKRGPFIKYLYYLTWMQLMTITTKSYKQKQKQIQLEYISMSTEKTTLPPNHFLEGFGEDALRIINLLKDLPTDLARMFMEEDMFRDIDMRSAESRKNTLKTYLGQTGWSPKRIKFAFADIQEQLA